MDVHALRTIVDRDDWMLHAACGGRHDLFFSPEAGETRSERREREAEAKAVCAACRVRAECLEEAIRSGERFGIWGGLNAQERRGLSPKIPHPSPQDIAGPGRLARLPAVVVQGRSMSPGGVGGDPGPETSSQINPAGRPQGRGVLRRPDTL